MNIIGFERGRNPKKGLSLGIEGYKKKYRILVVETEFKDIEVAADSVFGADQFGARKVLTKFGSIKNLYDAHFVIIHNDKDFMIVKMRFGPAFSGTSPANTTAITFTTDWKYPKNRLNDCIMWLGEISEEWNKMEGTDGYKL
jgi:hypothetical protein